ncbi:MAG TPA: hypothetical protein VK507_06000 [Iamia sp.]|nr:hypothetical protein [Iamia sp.]
MRQLAGVVGSLGLLLAAFFALSPVTVDVPHHDGRCGPPLVRYAAQEHDDDPNEQAVIDACEAKAEDQLVVAGIAAGVGTLGFVVLRLIAGRHAVVERRRRRARRQRADDEARQAAEHQAELETAAARDAALRG